MVQYKFKKNKTDNPYSKKSGYPISAEERIKEVMATFELEGMPLSKADIQALKDLEEGKVTPEEARRNLLKEIESHKSVISV